MVSTECILLLHHCKVKKIVSQGPAVLYSVSLTTLTPSIHPYLALLFLLYDFLIYSWFYFLAVSPHHHPKQIYCPFLVEHLES